ncbi:hypothetical protein PENSPDRAFT_624637 [Peniophora sp. CONT]|nr:hypothetical protein PENSPDRAFT_624637 [Peniophora sp. CONT]
MIDSRQDSQKGAPDSDEADAFLHQEPRSSISEDQDIDRMWTYYLRKAQRVDKEMTDAWKGDTDGILIFTGLFSATVASFIVDNYKSLQLDPSVFLLAQISANMTGNSLGATLAGAGVSTSGPPVHVNILWVLSLCLSISCALLATLVQQWARHYLRLSQRRQDVPGLQARLHAYLSQGISTSGVRVFVNMIPALLTSAVALFFAGLVELYFTISNTVAYVALAFLVMFAIIYTGLTLLPLVSRYTPFHTPLTPIIWWSTSHVVAIIHSCLRLSRSLVYIAHTSLKAHRASAIYRSGLWAEAWDYSYFASPLRRFLTARIADIERTVLLTPWSTAECSSLIYTIVGFDLTSEDVRQVFNGLIAVFRRHSSRVESQQISYVPVARFLLSELPVRQALTRLCDDPGVNDTNGIRTCMNLVWEFATCFPRPSYEAVEIFPLPPTQHRRLALMKALTALHAHPRQSVAITARCWLALELGDVKPTHTIFPQTFAFYTHPDGLGEYRIEPSRQAWTRDQFSLNVLGLLSDTLPRISDTAQGRVALFLVSGVVLRLLHWEKYERPDIQEAPTPVLLSELEHQRQTVRRRLETLGEKRGKMDHWSGYDGTSEEIRAQYEALDELLRQVEERVVPRTGVPTLLVPKPTRLKMVAPGHLGV